MSDPCDESNLTGEKRAYECPIVVPLGSLQDGLGGVCATGVGDSGSCNVGITPGPAFGCTGGSNANSCHIGRGVL